jgi:anti-sigma B factor antagonist
MVPLLSVEELRDDDGRLRLRLEGELDMSTEPLLRTALHKAAEGGEPVVVDLSGVEFMDSSGLRVLIQAHQHAQRDGWSLALTAPSPPVRSLFEVAGVVEVLPLEP